MVGIAGHWCLSVGQCIRQTRYRCKGRRMPYNVLQRFACSCTRDGKIANIRPLPVGCAAQPKLCVVMSNKTVPMMETICLMAVSRLVQRSRPSPLLHCPECGHIKTCMMS